MHFLKKLEDDSASLHDFKLLRHQSKISLKLTRLA